MQACVNAHTTPWKTTDKKLGTKETHLQKLPPKPCVNTGEASLESFEGRDVLQNPSKNPCTRGMKAHPQRPELKGTAASCIHESFLTCEEEVTAKFEVLTGVMGVKPSLLFLPAPLKIGLSKQDCSRRCYSAERGLIAE